MSGGWRRLRWLVSVVSILAAVALAAPATVAQDNRPGSDPVTIYRVHVKNQADVDRLAASGYDLVESRGPDYLLVVGDAAVEAALRAEGFRVTVDRTLAPLPKIDRRPGAEANSSLTAQYFGGYRTVDEHYAHLDAVAAAYPQLAQVVDYGDSWRKTTGQPGGNDLMAICLTARQPGDCALSPESAKPRSLIMAAIHARELQTSEIAWRLIDELTQGYGVDADLTMLMDTTEIWIVPVVNPDGREIVESGGNAPYLQRKNANNTLGSCAVPPTASNQHGVDLNRNASYRWGGVGTTTDPCAQTYRGPTPASEPEQQALQTLFTQLFPDQRGPNLTDPAPSTARGSFITIHSYGNLVLLPPGEGGTTANDAQLRALAFRMSHFNGYRTGTGPEILYGTTGTTDDWVYGELGVPAFTYEVSPSSGTCSGFTPAYSCVDSVLYPLNRTALLYAVRVAAAPYVLPAGPTVTNLTAPDVVAPGAGISVTATVNDNALGSASGSVGRPAAQAVAGAEYAIGTAPWAGGTTVAMTAADGSFNASTENATATIPTTGLADGRHTIWVRGRDASGNWGPWAARYVTIDPNAPPPPTTLFTDDFEAGAGNWSALFGNASWSLVTDGTVRYQGSVSRSGDTGERVAGQSTWGNYAVEVNTKTTIKRSTARGPGVLARVVDSRNHYRFAYTSTNRWAISRVRNGSVTTLAQSGTTSLATNATYVLRAEVQGNQLRFYVNGNLVASATDSSFATGRIGLRVYGSVTRFDDVVVTPL